MTPRNIKFIELLIQYTVLNKAPAGKRNSAAQAFRDAGYKSKRPDVDAFKLLEKPSIRAEFERRKKEVLSKMQVTTERIVQEMCRIGFSDISDYYDDEGKLKPLKQLTKEQTAAIAEVCHDKYGNLQYKLWSKTGTLELLGRYQKMFTDKVAIGQDPDGAPMSININFNGSIPRPDPKDLKRPE